MAYSIGPKFNPIDVQPIMDNYKAGVERMDKQNAESFDRMMTGLKGIGTGIGKARQWMEAERIKQEMEERLKQLMDARQAANDELIGLNQMRDEAKGKVIGINNMLPELEVAPNYPFRNDLDNDPASYYPYANFPKNSYQSVMGKKAGL